MASFPLGKYKHSNTFFHNLDARVKIFAMVLFMVMLFLNFASKWMDFLFYGVMFVIVLIIMKISHIKIRNLFRVLKPMWFMLVFLFIVNALALKEGNPIDLGFMIIYDQAIYYTVYTFLRIILMLAFSLILTSTTRPMDLTYALEWYLHPLTFIKIPVHIIVMIISLSLRFIPTLLEETDRIMKAQSSRGVDFENGKFLEKIKAIISLIVPLFISSIQRSSELADAMEVRGYDPDAKRTRYRIMKIHKRDVFSLLFLLFFLVGVILLICFKVDAFFWVI